MSRGDYLVDEALADASDIGLEEWASIMDQIPSVARIAAAADAVGDWEQEAATVYDIQCEVEEWLYRHADWVSGTDRDAVLDLVEGAIGAARRLN